MAALYEQICLEISKGRIKNITSDPQKVGKDFLFYAPSEKEHAHIREAINRGAKSILTNQKYEECLEQGVDFFVHAQPQQIYHGICSFMWKKQPTFVCAIIGTSGRKSVGHFFSQVCTLAGKKAVTLSVSNEPMDTPKLWQEKDHLISDAADMYNILDDLAERRIEYCCLAISAAAIESRMIDSVNLKAAAFTNLLRDDLEQPEDVDRRLQTKIRLLSEILPENGIMVLPVASEYTTRIMQHCPNKKVCTYGRATSDIQLISQLPTQKGQILTMKILGKEMVVHTNILGKFQGNNLVTAMGLAISCGIDPSSIEHEQISPLAGYMEFLEDYGEERKIMTDCAQTPSELHDLLLSIKWHFPYNDVTLVLRCSENYEARNTLKMAKIAAKMVNRIIFTSDSHGSMLTEKTRRELMSCCPKAIEIEDRKKAMEYAINNCKPSEIIVMQGVKSSIDKSSVADDAAAMLKAVVAPQ
ncbi:Mur ligase family protein [Neorickettsia risticii]|uniref:Mur ligase middle domain family n=1 Tax=Neorickettsia risticii (strain Illinois) TaxID=434131 RepID=C6V4B1_NEORI|nr:Mur ligase family protein [Neorickettsia risticii]ACT69228.1 Mur ligase middle domain family [Neorickettsia risticii str. Illinois]